MQRALLVGAAVVSAISFAVSAYYEARQHRLAEIQDCRFTAQDFNAFDPQNDPDPEARSAAIRTRLEECDGRPRPTLPARTTVPNDPER